MQKALLLRKLETTLLCLMLAAHGLVFGFVFLVPQLVYQEVVLFSDALPFSWLALTLLWLVLGPARWYVRLPIGLLLLGLQAWLISRIEGDNLYHFRETIAAIAAAELLFLLLAVGFTRLFGWGIAYCEVEPMGRKFQFSIRGVMGLTFATALSLSAFQWSRANLESVNAARMFLGVVFAVSALMAAWTLLRPGGVWLRLGLFCIAIPLFATLPSLLSGWSDGFPTAMIWLGEHAALLAGSLAIMRMCGYRLVRLRTIQPSVKNEMKVQQTVAITKQTDLKPSLCK